MGDYSAICAVTGLPITSNQAVVGFEVEPYRYDLTRNRYVPKSWPVEGKYDMVGGIEGFDLSPNVVLVHKEVWKNSHKYWHYMNNKSGTSFFDTKHILEKGQSAFDIHSRTGYDKVQGWTLPDYVFCEIAHILQYTDEGLVLRDILESKAENVTNLPEKYSFIHRSAFGQLLTEKIINGWTENDSLTLYRLVCLYAGQMITGKQIAPSNQPYIEQYPDYKQRIKLLKFSLALAKKLQLDITH